MSDFVEKLSAMTFYNRISIALAKNCDMKYFKFQFQKNITPDSHVCMCDIDWLAKEKPFSVKYLFKVLVKTKFLAYLFKLANQNEQNIRVKLDCKLESDNGSQSNLNYTIQWIQSELNVKVDMTIKGDEVFFF